LLAFGLFIYALVLLWKVIPVFLTVPDNKRVGHYILSLVTIIAAMMIFSMTIGRFLMPSMDGPDFGTVSDTGRPSPAASSGMFSGMARQAELIAAAEEDRFDPPSDGRLSNEQVREFIRVMQRTEELQEQKAAKLEELAEKADKNEDMSFKDLGKMMSGVTEVAGLQTAEIEVVKSAGGNWAEHQWVRESLRTAWIQKDINDTVAHNFELYEEFEDELSGYVVH
ncbi:MAG: EF-hand domain-containing protein, partial [Woeseiaceae bacterium]